MRQIERHLDRILARLRVAIRERGYTQLEVQEVLGWGRSYISQLLNKQKAVRVEQILMILNVIHVEPKDFFGEIYRIDRRARRAEVLDRSTLLEELRRTRSLIDGLVSVLRRKDLITTQELDKATEAQTKRP